MLCLIIIYKLCSGSCAEGLHDSASLSSAIDEPITIMFSLCYGIQWLILIDCYSYSAVAYYSSDIIIGVVVGVFVLVLVLIVIIVCILVLLKRRRKSQGLYVIIRSQGCFQDFRRGGGGQIWASTIVLFLSYRERYSTQLNWGCSSSKLLILQPLKLLLVASETTYSSKYSWIFSRKCCEKGICFCMQGACTCVLEDKKRLFSPAWSTKIY